MESQKELLIAVAKRNYIQNDSDENPFQEKNGKT
jgi:hypothetical protein